MSMKQLTEIVDWRSVVEWLQKYESEYHRSFLNGLDLAYDFDCCKVEVFLNRSNISTIFWVELQCCEFLFWGWSATGAFYSRLSPVANSVKIASRCAGLVKRPIAAGLSWMMTMNSTELFVSFCCPKLSLNEILVDSFKMSEWLVYLNAWDFVKYDSSKYPCLSVYIYIYLYTYICTCTQTCTPMWWCANISTLNLPCLYSMRYPPSYTYTLNPPCMYSTRYSPRMEKLPNTEGFCFFQLTAFWYNIWYGSNQPRLLPICEWNDEWDWPPKGTCTTLRCRISLSSSIAVLAWHRTQLMDWMMTFFFFSSGYHGVWWTK